MDLKIPLEELRKHRLFVATPQYGGQNHGAYMKSCLALQALLGQLQVDVRFSFLFNESLIPRARNLLADEFLRSDFTHLLFLDGDLEFEPQDVVTLLALDKELAGAPYANKSINWDNIKKALLKNPDLGGAELEQLVGNYVFRTELATIPLSEPLEVSAIGAGFMLIKRSVLTTLARNFPEQNARPHAYFDTLIEDGEYLSEDYMFCRCWRKLGGKIWLCPWMRTTHWGSFGFRANLVELSRRI